MVAAVDAFYQRGDLDLLLASPVSPVRILTVRAIAIAVNPALLFWALATPFLLPAAVLGHPELLAVYPVIGAMALLATAAGLALAIFLFRVIGPRRTRTVAQVLGAVIGAIAGGTREKPVAPTRLEQAPCLAEHAANQRLGRSTAARIAEAARAASRQPPS